MYIMTQEHIQQAIDAIRAAGKEARRSPEASRQFLLDAGIIAPDIKKKKHAKKKK
jgi:hypothetical protein